MPRDDRWVSDIYLVRGVVVQAGVPPLEFVEINPVIDYVPQFHSAIEIIRIDAFVFERLPQPLDEDVSKPAAGSTPAPLAEDICRQESPEMREIKPGQQVACHLI